MANERVLLVDDEEDFVALLKERLETRDVEVKAAFDGEKAIELAKKFRFDAIVLDLQMPGMDGIETLKEILSYDPDAQVILLTGYATISKGVEAVKHGASDFMEKPANMPDLLEKIGEAASKRMILMQERSLEKIEHILKEKGW